jgi:putative transposase
MPWSHTSPMDQTTQFISDYLRQGVLISELCAHFGISRKTAYKWIDRYLHDGPQGLEDRSTRPSYRAEPHAAVYRCLDRVAHSPPSWGGGKLLAVIERRHRGWALPARSTGCEILKRSGLVSRKPSRRRVGHPGQPTRAILAANDCWSADFKGQFKNGDGRYCYSLWRPPAGPKKYLAFRTDRPNLVAFAATSSSSGAEAWDDL